MIRKSLIFGAVLALTPLGLSQGFFVGDNGAAPAGMGGAGVAFPQDLSTAIYNPAGLARVENGVQGSLALISFTNARYRRAPDVTNNFQPYPDETLERTNYIGGPFFAVAHDLGQERWTFGFSTVLQYGSKLDFDQNGVQRYMMKQVLLWVEDFNFSAAYEINDAWSVGGSLVWSYADVAEDIDLDLVSLIDPTALPSEEPQNRIPTEVALDDNGFGGVIGVLREGEKWKFGLMYHSAVKLTLTGDVTTDLTNIPQVIKDALGVTGNELALGATMDLELPQYARLGYSLRTGEKWWISTEIAWMDWSTLEAFDVKLEDNPINVTSYVIPRQWKDGWAYKAGIQYSHSEDTQFRVGAFWVDAPTKRQFVQLDIPDNDRFGATLGWAQRIKGPISFDAAYVHQFLNDWHISDSQQNPPVNGDIEVNFGTLLLGLRLDF